MPSGDINNYQKIAREFPSRVAAYRLREGRWQPVRWDDLWEQVVHAAQALRQLGLKPGDRIAIISAMSFDWQVAEMAVAQTGAILVGADPHALAEHFAYCLSYAQINTLIVDRLETLQRIPPEQLKALQFVISFSAAAGVASPSDISFYLWKDLMAAEFVTAPTLLPEVASEAPGSIIFTAGCEGSPKGALIANGPGWISTQVIKDSFLDAMEGGIISWLPSHQMYQRLLNHLGFTAGLPVYFLDDHQTILDAAREVRPHFLVSAPRFFEKIYKGIFTQLQQKPFWTRGLLYFGLWLQSTSEEAQHSRFHRFKRRLVDRLFFRGLRHKLFRPNFRFVVSIAAHSPLWLITFFDKIGVMFFSGYGMSESTLGVSCNRPGENRFGSVGKPFHVNEVKIAPDGEILFKSPGLFLRYYREYDPRNEEVMTPEGFFKTGDLGYFDREGYLYLRGRRSSVIHLADGLTIYPEEVEGIYRQILYVDHLMVTGQGRPYLTALITVDAGILSTEMKRAGFSFPSTDRFSQDLELKAYVARDLVRCGRFLSPEKRIKDFLILPSSFSVETGEITLTHKLRRKYIETKYQTLIESLYAS